MLSVCILCSQVIVVHSHVRAKPWSDKALKQQWTKLPTCCRLRSWDCCPSLSCKLSSCSEEQQMSQLCDEFADQQSYHRAVRCAVPPQPPQSQDWPPCPSTPAQMLGTVPGGLSSGVLHLFALNRTYMTILLAAVGRSCTNNSFASELSLMNDIICRQVAQSAQSRDCEP